MVLKKLFIIVALLKISCTLASDKRPNISDDRPNIKHKVIMHHLFDSNNYDQAATINGTPIDDKIITMWDDIEQEKNNNTNKEEPTLEYEKGILGILKRIKTGFIKNNAANPVRFETNIDAYERSLFYTKVFNTPKITLSVYYKEKDSTDFKQETFLIQEGSDGKKHIGSCPLAVTGLFATIVSGFAWFVYFVETSSHTSTIYL